MQPYNNRIYWKGIIRKVNIIFFLKPLGSNAKKCQHCKNQFAFLKKKRTLIRDKYY